MKIICKECGCEFNDYNYIKGDDPSKICEECRQALEIAMNNDDYEYFEKYKLEKKKIYL